MPLQPHHIASLDQLMAEAGRELAKLRRLMEIRAAQAGKDQARADMAAYLMTFGRAKIISLLLASLGPDDDVQRPMETGDDV